LGNLQKVPKITGMEKAAKGKGTNENINEYVKSKGGGSLEREWGVSGGVGGGGWLEIRKGKGAQKE